MRATGQVAGRAVALIRPRPAAAGRAAARALDFARRLADRRSRRPLRDVRCAPLLHRPAWLADPADDAARPAPRVRSALPQVQGAWERRWRAGALAPPPPPGSGMRAAVRGVTATRAARLGAALVLRPGVAPDDAPRLTRTVGTSGPKTGGRETPPSERGQVPPLRVAARRMFRAAPAPALHVVPSAEAAAARRRRDDGHSARPVRLRLRGRLPAADAIPATSPMPALRPLMSRLASPRLTHGPRTSRSASPLYGRAPAAVFPVAHLPPSLPSGRPVQRGRGAAIMAGRAHVLAGPPAANVEAPDAALLSFHRVRGGAGRNTRAATALGAPRAAPPVAADRPRAASATPAAVTGMERSRAARSPARSGGTASAVAARPFMPRRHAPAVVGAAAARLRLSGYPPAVTGPCTLLAAALRSAVLDAAVAAEPRLASTASSFPPRAPSLAGPPLSLSEQAVAGRTLARSAPRGDLERPPGGRLAFAHLSRNTAPPAAPGGSAPVRRSGVVRVPTFPRQEQVRRLAPVGVADAPPLSAFRVASAPVRPSLSAAATPGGVHTAAAPFLRWGASQAVDVVQKSLARFRPSAAVADARMGAAGTRRVLGVAPSTSGSRRVEALLPATMFAAARLVPARRPFDSGLHAASASDASAAARREEPPRPSLPPAALDHAGAPQPLPVRGGRAVQRRLEAFADDPAPPDPWERTASPAQRRSAAAPPVADVRAIADRVYDVLVDRVRQERRARGF